MYKIVRPLLFRGDPENIHDKALTIGRYLSESSLKKLIGFLYDFQDSRLESDFCGISFPNPVGLAAGFDKNAELVNFLPYIGFGFVEIGSVTAEGGKGNTKPRLFRLVEDEAIINRMGLNNYGAERIQERLRKIRPKVPLGVNIAKTHGPGILGELAIRDFCYSFERLYPRGDYITINISCPNTEEGKTFEDKTALEELLSSLMEKRDCISRYKKPVLIKISPDISFEELDDILEVSEKYGINGYVISNTSSRREWLSTPSEHIEKIGKGGLSGKPIRERSTELIRYVYEGLDKPNIIGVGGISSAENAYEKIRAGACLIQVFTGLVYEGPGLVRRIKKGLVNLMERDGFSSISEAVGT